MPSFVRRWVCRVDPYFLLVWVFGLLALAPVFAPGYFYSAHDGRHSVFYLIMFDASIRDGALWPRWAMHHIQGYGYPTFIIQAPLGFYVAEIFILLGAGYTLAAKLTWITGFLAGGWGMYRLVIYWLDSDTNVETNRVISRLAALVASLLYIFIPYHLEDIYVRAALNDSLLLAWFPWVFMAFDRLIDRGATPGWQRRLALAALLLAGLLLTHTFALISFTPLLMTFILFRLYVAWRQEQRASHIGQNSTSGKATLMRLIRRTLLAGAAGLGALLLIATFLLPLLVEGRYLQQQVYVTNTYDFHNHFVQLGQFFSPFWGFGFSDDPTGANDGMSFQIGVIGVLFGLVALYLLVRKAEPKWNRRALLGYLTVVTATLLFIMTPAAAPIWDAIPLLAVIQFPWRLLALTAFTISALSSLVIANLLQEGVLNKQMLTVQELTGSVLVLGLLVIFGSYPYIVAQLQPVEPWREDGARSSDLSANILT